MKQINGYTMLTVPEGSTGFSISYEYNPLCVWLHMKGREFPMPIGNIIYPAKKVEIIGLAKDLTEEQWNNMVDNNQLGCFDNYRGKSDERYTCQTATESGHSLLKANNLNLNNCLILKKIL